MLRPTKVLRRPGQELRISGVADRGIRKNFVAFTISGFYALVVIVTLLDVRLSGLKIDFFDHEHKEVIDLYEMFAKAAAQHKLMVDFHGCNKPTGMERTYPNIVGMEAIS